MDDVCGCAGVMSCLTSCHVMTKEDIMVCKMIGKIGEKWVVSLQYSQPACFRFRVYKMLLCEGYVLTQRLDPIDVIHVCPTLRPIAEFCSVEYKTSYLL
jgi:hypothetical protein